MSLYRVSRKIVDKTALEVATAYYVSVGKWFNRFAKGDEKKVSKWAESIWENDGKAINKKSPCRIYAITPTTKVLYAIYKPLERLP